MEAQSPSDRVFLALLSGNVRELTECSEIELRPFLPLLSRMILSPTAPQYNALKKIVHMVIIGMPEVNAISEYLNLNFKANS